MKKLLVAEEDEGRVISQDEEGCRPIVKKKRMQFSASEMEEWEKPLSSEDFTEEDTDGWIKCDFLFCTVKRYKKRERLMREKRLKQSTLSRPIDVYSKTDAAANEKQENSKGGPKSKQSRGCVREKKKASDVFEIKSVRLIDEERQEPTQTMIKRPRKAAVGTPEPDREIPQDIKNKIIEGLGGMLLRNSIEGSGGTDILLVCENCDLGLRRWEMRKNGGKSSTVSYVLARGWNGVVARNDLKKGDLVQVWSFRVGLELGLAMIAKHN
ncbi:hypothetical protein CRG98_026417 [Punica granatum]|uniref:TF-B3 domain-containing protein n=1 Tax=Punica granatum TaxID=22663 RepID=A0A2I0JC33_PUNGR|nr:hypothetical protein CRG98_026417 [Punica granatum]